jgi:hypothetical protein
MSPLHKITIAVTALFLGLLLWVAQHQNDHPVAPLPSPGVSLPQAPPLPVPAPESVAPAASQAPTTTVAPAPRTTGARLRSTAYCLTGGMASGRPTYVGAVASNRYRLGTVLTAWPNPWGNPAMRFTVEDRHRDGATELDFSMPSECGRALRWGNRNYVTVRVVD